MSVLDSLVFDNRFSEELPSDSVTVNAPRQVRGALFSRVEPTPTSAPSVIARSDEMLELLGITEEQANSAEFVDMVSGNLVLPGLDSFAMRYGGHQFGNWAGQLGDGRAINLGELSTPDHGRQTLQLKGAGPTPYSRSADGLAVLRSSVREFITSEAMFHLGVPTTRALSLALTGDEVMRDMLYDGNPALEPGAVVCRVAPSFIRFGSFELPSSLNEIDLLTTLADFTIREYFPDLWPDDGRPNAQTYADFYGQVVRSTADMINHWQRVGFVHGVMNTDNMSILGLTIDYGPYGWLEDYDPDWTPNTTDRHGKRYRFANQAGVGHWNLMQLANALVPLVDDPKMLQDGLDGYVAYFREGHQEMFAAKLGLAAWDVDRDDQLMLDLLDLMAAAETDMTLFYRGLANVSTDDGVSADDRFAPLLEAFYLPDEQLTDELRGGWDAWLDRYCARVRSDGTANGKRKEAMDATNPLYVMRNYLAQLAIDASTEGDHSKISELLDVMGNPYTEQPGMERFAEKRPDWARTRVGCSMLSCSS